MTVSADNIANVLKKRHFWIGKNETIKHGIRRTSLSRQKSDRKTAWSKQESIVEHSNRERIRTRLQMLYKYKGYGKGLGRLLNGLVTFVTMLMLVSMVIAALWYPDMNESGIVYESMEEWSFFLLRNDDNDDTENEEEELDGWHAHGTWREHCFSYLRIVDTV